MADAKRAKEFFDQAVIAAKENPAMAYPLLCSAAIINPFDPQIWVELGAAADRGGLRTGAIAAYRAGLLVAPENPYLMVNLGNQFYHAGKIEDSLRLTKAAIKIKPDLPEPWTNLSMIQTALKNDAAAIDAARQAIKLSDKPVYKLGLAFALLNAGKFAEGLVNLEARFPEKLINFQQYPYPQWRGESGEGKILFLSAEQGMGDAISFMRFVPAVMPRFEKTIIAVHGPLMRLFESFRYYPGVEVIPLPCPLPAADYWTTFSSLPTALGLNDETIAKTPQCTVTPPATPTPWKNVDRTFHVGIAWAGDPSNGIDHWRSIALADMLAFTGLDKRIQVYSLQVGARAADINSLGVVPVITDVGQYIRDVVDTLSIFENLDLVICIESSIRHMAALARKEAWVLVPRFGCDWRLSYGTRPPIWADKHVLFRQGDGESWPKVIQRVCSRLKRRLDGKDE